jgi:tetratricopeptide (TPR) repeat protein
MKLRLLLLTAAAAAILAGGAGFPATAPTPEEIKKLRAILDAPPPNPKDHFKAALVKIYLERGRAASALGEFDRELKELTAGIEAVGAKDPNAYDLHQRRAQLYLDRGDYVSARAAREAALETAGTTGRKFFQLNYLSSISAVLRDRDSAKAYLSQADALLSNVRGGSLEWGRFGDLWQAALNETRGNYNLSYGYFIEAEKNFRDCATAIRTYLGKNPKASEDIYYYLPQCLSRTVELGARLGHLREASAYVNDVRDTAKAYAQDQQRILFDTRMARSIARVYLEQGLVAEAKALLESTIAQTDKVQRGDAALQAADIRFLLALIDMTQGNWAKADEHFRARRDKLRANKSQAEELDIDFIPEWGYALLRLGKTAEARQISSAALSAREKKYDEQSLYLWESRAFHSLVMGATDEKESAVKMLGVAVPKIFELGRGQGSTESGWLTTIRLGWILDGYVGLLADLHRAGARPSGIEPYAEAFRIADIARSSRVQKALSAAIVRGGINDPELAAVLRKAQDLDYQVKATSEALTALQGGKSTPEREKLMEKTRGELERLRADNEKVQAELKRKMPDYSDLLDAKPVTITDAQTLL